MDMCKNSLFDRLGITTKKCDDLFDDGRVFFFIFLVCLVDDESLLLSVGYELIIVFIFGFKFCYHTPSFIQSKIEITIKLPLPKNTRFHRSKFQYLSEILEKFFDMISVVFGSDIDGSVLTSFSCDKNRWKIFFGDFDKTVAIVSFEQAIEWRLMFFDKIGF
jgi:hypothetical protein